MRTAVVALIDEPNPLHEPVLEHHRAIDPSTAGHAGAGKQYRPGHAGSTADVHVREGDTVAKYAIRPEVGRNHALPYCALVAYESAT